MCLHRAGFVSGRSGSVTSAQPHDFIISIYKTNSTEMPGLPVRDIGWSNTEGDLQCENAQKMGSLLCPLIRDCSLAYWNDLVKVKDLLQDIFETLPNKSYSVWRSCIQSVTTAFSFKTKRTSNVCVSSAPVSLVMVSPFAWFLSYIRN